MLPKVFRKIVAKRLSTNFREATEIITAEMPQTIRGTEMIVRNKFVGINASDINFTAGIYLPDVVPPFDCGFEAIGEVVKLGEQIKNFKIGDPVVTQSFGSFSEYQTIPSRHAKSIPSLEKHWLPLDLSGTTASIALEEVLKPRKGEVALISAASGGTGQFALQLLKNIYGCKVIALCSSERKQEFLQSNFSPDAIININSMNLLESLRALPFASRGINIAYESVGGDLFSQVVDSLALKGRILSIGSISNYSEGSIENNTNQKPLQLRLLSKSATLHTFFLPHYTKVSKPHFEKLCSLLQTNQLKSAVDSTEFHGLESIPLAIDHMYYRRNLGKVMVQLY